MPRSKRKRGGFPWPFKKKSKIILNYADKFHDSTSFGTQEWLAIENIILHPYQKQFLLPVDLDPCQSINEDCESNSTCIKYENSNGETKCVTKDRIQKFEVGTTIVGKNKQKYKIVSSNRLKWLNTFDIAWYYRLLSESTNHTYILFNSGRVIEHKQLSYIYNGLLKSLIQEILQETSEQKIILCGHSMGCVLSLYTGMMIQNENKIFFDSKIVIVGSAPFRFLEKNTTFKNLPNVKVFCFYERQSELSTVIDCYRFQPRASTDITYEPLTYITQDKQTLESSITYEDEFNKDTIGFFTDDCDNKHAWSNYFEVLTKLYPFDVNQGGRRKIHTKKKRKKN